MTLDQAICEATAQAKKNSVEMVVVDDPISNAEESDGTFGYCPAGAEKLLFRWGKILRKISSSGVVVICEEAVSGQYVRLVPERAS